MIRLCKGIREGEAMKGGEEGERWEEPQPWAYITGRGRQTSPPPRIWSGDDNVDNANSPPPHFVIYSEFQALVCLHYYAIKFTA